jgi:hypothetical protein
MHSCATPRPGIWAPVFTNFNPRANPGTTSSRAASADRAWHATTSRKLDSEPTIPLAGNQRPQCSLRHLRLLLSGRPRGPVRDASVSLDLNRFEKPLSFRGDHPVSIMNVEDASQSEFRMKVSCASQALVYVNWSVDGRQSVRLEVGTSSQQSWDICRVL